MIVIYIMIVILCILLFLASIKIYMMKKSIKEIQILLKKILQADTNAVITITSRDKGIKQLANEINRELKVLRKEKLQYQNGNQELKRIVTNISHDMRTPLTAIMGYIELLRDNKEKQDTYLEIIGKKN